MPNKILVVDDDQSLRELLKLHLSSAGYDVTVAADGIEGGYAVLRDRPDLIISDVQMPHMDGYAFIGALKEDPSVSGIPVIFLTSLDEPDRGRALGAVGFLNKPIRADRLLAIVAEHLPNGSYPIG